MIETQEESIAARSATRLKTRKRRMFSRPHTPIDVGYIGANRVENGGDEVTKKVTPKKGRKNRVRKWQPVFLRELSMWGNVSRACKKACVSRKSAYDAKESDDSFKAAWTDALDVACDALEEEARRRAMNGTDEGVFYQGQKVAKLLKYSDTLLIFLLKAHRPEKYRENTRNENWNIDPRDWTDAQIEAYRSGVPLVQVLAMKGVSADRTA